MAERDIAYKVSVDSGNAGKSLKDLKREFKEIQSELSGLDRTSKEYTETLKRLGETKDDIALLNDQVNAFADDAGQIKAVGNVVQGLGGAFAAAQGAAALFGSENEDLQKTLVKLQAVMAFQQGLEGIKNLGDSFKVLWQIIRANPLGAILTAITALTTAGIALYESMDKSSEATKDLNRQLSLQKEITETLTKSTDRQIQLLEAQGASEETIIEVKKKLVQQQMLEIETSIKLHQSKIEDIKTNNSITESYWEMIKTIQLKTGQEEQAAATQQIINALKLQRAKEDLEAIKKEKEELADLRTKFEVLEIQKTKVHADEINKRLEAENKHRQDIEALWNQSIADDLERRINSAKTYDELKAEELQKLIETEQELADIEVEIMQQKVEAKKELTQEEVQDRLAATAQAVEATKAFTDILFEYQLNKAQGNAAKEKEIKKKQFQVNKAFSVAQIVLNTIMGVMQAISSSPPPMSWVLAGINSAMGTAATIKALAQKFDGGGASGGGGGGFSMPSVSAPSITPPSQGSTQLNSDGSVKIHDSAMQPTVKAVVVETDITKTQKKVGSMEVNSKF